MATKKDNNEMPEDNIEDEDPRMAMTEEQRCGAGVPCGIQVRDRECAWMREEAQDRIRDRRAGGSRRCQHLHGDEGAAAH